ncbi:polyketide-8 synthase acyl carrier protein [Amycolatopsis sp. WAC 01375]|uniref:acyl carrier protein n=1 Tax=unclassified Amycolatopsis TaxID=2618356 RepID=UPI000F795E82|nr:MULTISPECIES: acyl carrier protein [unclassified Amycolatopsis]RSM52503.1 polyketide-8 synthase acyl carrier protein [Amycolatopsis sp. WAC 01376]RSM76850.1 polyketide-8 synthase acyl carrier protein [Amycolatopsis sp. WAC 01375]RSN25951.1 polyketide-8 synthase acyl carrier protein [Amycolatopsis sp. WAC 01416]
MTGNKLIEPELEDLRTLVARVLEVESAEVTDEANLVEDLGVDSLLLLEVAARILQRYGIRVGDAAISEVETLDEIHQLVLAGQKG